MECGGADILLFGYTQLLYLIFDKFTFNNNGCDNMRTCPNCGHEMLNDNFAECPKCGFNLLSYDKKNNSLLSNINKKLPKSIGDISEQITTQVKKEEAYIKSRLDDDSTALVDDNEFFISKTVFDGVDYITNKKQDFEKERASKNQNKNTTSVKVDNNINQETENPKKDISDEIKKEPVQESKINENETVEDEKPQQETSKTFYNKKASNAKNIKKEFDNQLKFYIGSFRGSEDFKKRLIRHNKMFGDTNLYSIKNILKNEFENGNLALEDVEERIDELLELDVLALQHDVVGKKRDSSVIKTQEDLNNYLGSEYISKFKKKVDRKSKGEELFKKYNVNVENAHCFECKLAEQRRDTVMTEFKENNWGNGYVALFDDKLVIADETFLLKVNLSVEKVFFNNIDFISFEEGDEESTSTLYIGLRTKGQIILGYILPEDANKVIEKYEKYTGKSSSSENTSNADELLKYAELYKQGLLSEEEFEAKKKELL